MKKKRNKRLVREDRMATQVVAKLGGATQAAEIIKGLESQMTYRINSDKSAAVSTDQFFRPMSCCPKGVKVIALSKHGVARIDIYSGQDDLVGWFPMPRVPKEMRGVNA
jgi:hypothetical protein